MHITPPPQQAKYRTTRGELASTTHALEQSKALAQSLEDRMGLLQAQHLGDVKRLRGEADRVRERCVGLLWFDLCVRGSSPPTCVQPSTSTPPIHIPVLFIYKTHTHIQTTTPPPPPQAG